MQTSELLARVRQRKQQLQAAQSKSEQANAKPNPYIPQFPADPASKPKPVVHSTGSNVQCIENEIAFKPQPPPLDFYNQFIQPDLKITDEYLNFIIEPEAEIQVPLTKQEIHRQKQIKRQLEAKEDFENIHNDTVKPKEPKLTLKNVQNVYKNEFINDPTKYELMAQEQVEQRKQEHLEANLERKLSPEQKWQKKQDKLMSHRSNLYAVVHKLDLNEANVSNAKLISILQSTAKDSMFSGCLLLSKSENNRGPAMLIYEGGKVEINTFKRKFIKLIEPTELWEGTIRTPNFHKWSVHAFDSNLEFLKSHDLEFLYWLERDLAYIHQ